MPNNAERATTSYGILASGEVRRPLHNSSAPISGPKGEMHS